MENKSKISLRKANFNDIEFLWYLRNQADVYKYSRQSRTINWKEHISWIMPIILGLSNKELFIIENSKIPIGQVRCDYKNHKEVEVSISLLKEFWGKGFATRSLKSIIKQIKKQGKVQRLIAEVNKNNITSQKLFEKLNFKLKGQKGQWLKYIFNT